MLCVDSVNCEWKMYKDGRSAPEYVSQSQDYDTGKKNSLLSTKLADLEVLLKEFANLRFGHLLAR